jgi:hypothetical protein
VAAINKTGIKISDYHKSRVSKVKSGWSSCAR